MCMLVCTRVFFPVWKAMLLIRPQRVAWSTVEVQLELDSKALTVHRTTPETVVLTVALLTKFHLGKLAKFLWMTWDKFALWSTIFCCLWLHSFITVQTVCKCVCKTPCFYHIFAKIMLLLHESSPSVPDLLTYCLYTYLSLSSSCFFFFYPSVSPFLPITIYLAAVSISPSPPLQWIGLGSGPFGQWSKWQLWQGPDFTLVPSVTSSYAPVSFQ